MIVFSIVMIVTLIFQGALICYLVNRAIQTTHALCVLYAYFDRLAQDIGYNPIIEAESPYESEMKKWSDSRRAKDE